MSKRTRKNSKVSEDITQFAENGDLENVKRLVEAGVDINMRDNVSRLLDRVEIMLI